MHHRFHTFIATLILGAVLCGSAVAAEKLTLDKEKSKITFVGSKPEGKHDGGFKTFEVSAMADFDQAENSSLEIMIDTASLWSDDEKLTNHLKNPDFFDVRKYPKIQFKSTKIEAGGGDSTVKFIGKMKMLDKEVEVTIPASFELSDTSLKLVADFKIDRTKWGMSYGEGKIDNMVAIKATFVLNR